VRLFVLIPFIAGQWSLRIAADSPIVEVGAS